MSAGAPAPSARRALLEPLPAPAWYSLGALGLAVAAGGLLIGRPAGLGLTLLLWALGALAGGAVRRPDRWAVAWWASFALLAAVPTVRAAGWVVAVSLLGAGVFASLAVAGGSTWREVARGAFAWLVHFVPGPVVVFALAGQRRLGQTAPIVRGTLVALPLLWLFGALFAAADAAFAEIVDGGFAWLDGLGDDFWGRVALGLAVIAVAGSLLRASHAPSPETGERKRRLGRVEWVIVLGALDALFAAFVAVQLAALFGGHDFVSETAGLTYADYARQGFGQLLAVAALTLAIIAVARRDDRGVRWLLGGLCVLTLVVLASALKRLGLYEEAFGYTRLRVSAHVAILWLGAIFALILAAGATRRPGLLPRAVVAVTAAFLIAFAASNPDLRIARGNLARGGELDRSYLNGLSADAAPALERCRPATGGVLSFNAGRSRADC